MPSSGHVILTVGVLSLDGFPGLGGEGLALLVDVILTVRVLSLDGVPGLGGEGLALLVDGGHLEPVEVARLQVLHCTLHRRGIHLKQRQQ